MRCAWLGLVLVADANDADQVRLGAGLLFEPVSNLDTRHVWQLAHSQHVRLYSSIKCGRWVCESLALRRQPIGAVCCLGCIHGVDMQDLVP